jgi:hypothetical protein
MRKKKKVRSWEGGKVGLEVGSRNAEGGKKKKVGRFLEVGSWNAERGKKEGGKDRGWEILRMGNLE